MILPAWFDHQEESFCFKEAQFINFLPVCKSQLKMLIKPLDYMKIQQFIFLAKRPRKMQRKESKGLST